MFKIITASIALGVITTPALASLDGSATGVFRNPQPGTTTNTGVGTNRITMGQAAGSTPASSLQFTGSSFSAPFDTAFRLGQLTFVNGTVTPGSDPTAVDVALTLSFGQPAIPPVTTSFTLRHVSTINTTNPDEGADFVFFPSAFGSNSFDIDGVRYNVEITGFRNVVGDGFLTSNSSRFRVRESRWQPFPSRRPGR